MRPDTSTADVAGFAVAAGIVTAVGARTAHAALVARQMGKPCIVGCGGMTIDVAADRAQLAGTTISGGDWITIDGDSGNIYLGRRDTVETRPEAELAEIAGWRSQAAAAPRRSQAEVHRVIRLGTERPAHSRRSRGQAADRAGRASPRLPQKAALGGLI